MTYGRQCHHNNDIWIMGLANLIGRLTSVMSQIGIILLTLNQPFLLAGKIPRLLVALLIFSPLVSTILQLSLSRIREYDDDLYAVSLTDDPQGLAQALQKTRLYRDRALAKGPLPRRLFIAAFNTTQSPAKKATH